MHKQEEWRDDPAQTSRVREGRTMGETERGRDALRGLEEVSRRERQATERQRATGTREAERGRKR